ncbi:MAG: hypothetical protein NC453_12575 [Muribaculum sp.]|nr:hypothetical protein [Muribaculum sp.]
MIFSNKTIEQLREKSGLNFDRASDFSSLAALIANDTKHTIGVTTLKRLFGYIEDTRVTNQSTLNIIAQYLGYKSWEVYANSFRIDSDWNDDHETIWIENLMTGTKIEVAYLNRYVCFEVLEYDGFKALKVTSANNSSLKIGDIAFIDRLRKGERLEARKVIRGTVLGSYKTNGELKRITVTNDTLPKE